MSTPCPIARLPIEQAIEPDGVKSFFIGGRIAAILNAQLYPHEGAAAVGVIGNRTHASVAYERLSRFADRAIPEEELRVPPDLVVLIFSPVNPKRDVFGEVDDYLSQGVLLVWTVNPASKRIRVYRQDGTTRSFQACEVIENEPILPGFRLLVGEVFPAAPVPN